MTATVESVSPVYPVLVETKLHVPDLRRGLVERQTLVDRLIGAEGCRLALICAPAGWGKTVLLTEWHASPAEKRPFAWVSLDEGDGDPVRFWSYVVAAVRSVDVSLGSAALAGLPMTRADPCDAFVAPLINNLAASPNGLVLVLDDYHLVHGEAVHESVDFLLRHLPVNIQLAIATRGDPPLHLAGLRAAGEVVEVRAAELAFTGLEAEAFLNGSLGLDLDEREVEILRVRTEGWAAGLRLAGLSVQAQDDRRAFVESFAGDDRQIGDYLQEVLADQPAAVRSFLLRTSVLERMCAPLCDAVTGSGDATRRLQAIERSNLFLVPLDSHREWYRYHHLFRDLLRRELNRVDPDLESELHRKAAAWCHEHGEIDEAIAHAVATEDFTEARELIAQYWRRFAFHFGQVETVARWLDRLPREDVLRDPRLCLARGWIATLYGHHEEVPEYLVAAESAESAPGPLHAIAASLESAVAQLRTVHSLSVGDVAAATEAGRHALELEPDGASLGRAVTNINLGAALYFSGQVTDARAALEAGIRRLRADDWRTEAVIVGLACTAAIHADAGRIVQAEQAAADAEQVIRSWQRGEPARGIPGSRPRPTSDAETPLLWTRGMSPRVMYVVGKLSEHRGDLVAADEALSRAVDLARRGRRRLDLTQALISQARLKRRQREHDAARALAREARQVLETCPDPGILAELLRKTERALQLQSGARVEAVLPVDLDLSERELTILRLLAGELSQREIGAELYISLNTVKGHVRSIFRKLGVATRKEAVVRGRELSLI